MADARLNTHPQGPDPQLHGGFRPTAENGQHMSENTSESGSVSASEAARIMSDPNATEEERSVAASVLRQSDDRGGETSAWVAAEAGDLTRDGDSEEVRSVAASDLSQADKERDENS